MLTSLFDLPAKYADLDAKVHAQGAKVFISDWNGTHPFVKDYLAPLEKYKYLDGDVTSYALPEEDYNLHNKIRSFHATADGSYMQQSAVIVGDGSTPLLSTFCFWLNLQGEREIYYLPPLFWSIAGMLKMLKMSPHSVSLKHAFEQDCQLDLPRSKSVLLLSDPIWHVGLRVPLKHLQTLRRWQESTDSLIFVDGTFQYMQWNGSQKEWSADLCPHRTFRLVCPTKSLSLHGFRFAYLLLPSKHFDSVTEVYETSHGASSYANLKFAHRAMDIMRSEENNQSMIAYAQANYHKLLDAGALRTHVRPECGYFVFGQPDVSSSEFVAMDQGHFEQEGFPGYVRINLLNPDAMKLLLGNKTNPP